MHTSRALQLIAILFLTLLFGACGNGAENGVATEEAEVDPESGLPLNPTTVPTGEFVVDGRISSLTLTPQTAPEFVIEAPSGKRYRVRSQAVSDISYDNGEPVLVHEFRQTMRVRATVRRDPDTGNLVTNDLTVMRPPAEGEAAPTPAD